MKTTQNHTIPKLVSKLRANGLTNSDFIHSLDKMTVFTGPNTAGKTSRLRALQLALLGYCPDLGKTLPANMVLCRGTSLDVSATVGDREIRRIWERDGTAVKTVLAPTEWSFPNVLLDPNVYFQMTHKAKVQYVFEHTSMPSLDGAKVMQSLKDSIEEPSPTIKELIERIDASDTERYELGQPVQDWLAKTLETLKNELKQARADEKRFGLIARESILNDPIPKDIEPQLKAKREALESLLTSGSALQARYSEVESTNRIRSDAIRRLTADLAAEERALKDHMECKTCPTCGTSGDVWQGRVVAQHTERIGALRKDFARIQSEAHIDPAALRSSLDKLKDSVDEVRGEIFELERLYKLSVSGEDSKARHKNASECTLKETLRIAALKPVIESLEGIQSELVVEAFSSVLSVANQVWGLVFEGLLDYKDGEVGLRLGDTFRPHSTFSGSEQAVCYLSVSAALAQSAPCRIVLMDELGRFTHDTQERLFESVRLAIERGLIDQFVGCGTSVNVPEYFQEIKL